MLSEEVHIARPGLQSCIYIAILSFYAVYVLVYYGAGVKF